MDSLDYSGQVLLLRGFDKRVVGVGVMVFIYDNTVKFQSRGRFVERFVHNLVYNREVLRERLWGMK